MRKGKEKLVAKIIIIKMNKQKSEHFSFNWQIHLTYLKIFRATLKVWINFSKYVQKIFTQKEIF